MFWKTSWSMVLPAPLSAGPAVTFRWLVAQDGSVDPAAPPAVLGAPAAEGDVAAVPAGDEGVEAGSVGEDAAEVPAVEGVGDESAAGPEASEVPHAVSASPAATNRSAGIPRPLFLVPMVSLFPVCRQ
ncbi:hypothetical protein [Streptomyces sp. NBC_01198]|uniref:hypothetical protein n=1 Tax=Streptomyces sp. NBC_01198 TaxID=2903769 RepID=UPI002E1290DF|nr:hypothetical protein OG702_21000 [Streptomyces sp. NBC_01198]